MGLSAVGFLIVVVTAYSAYSKACQRAKDAHEKMPEDFRGKFLVFVVLPSTCVLFSFVIVFLGWSADLDYELYFAVGLSMGLSALMVSIGFSLMTPQAIDAVAKGGSTAFGKAIASMELIEIPILTTFVATFLALRQPSCLGECVSASYMASASSFGAILGAAWATTSEVDQLSSRIGKSSISLIASLAGLIIALNMIGYL